MIRVLEVVLTSVGVVAVWWLVAICGFHGVMTSLRIERMRRGK